MCSVEGLLISSQSNPAPFASACLRSRAARPSILRSKQLIITKSYQYEKQQQ
jgi:hypothetical protein